MPYVQRNESGALKGVYANLQPGYAEDWLDDDHPDVIAFRNPPEPDVAEAPSPVEKLASFLASNPDVRALIEG